MTSRSDLSGQRDTQVVSTTPVSAATLAKKKATLKQAEELVQTSFRLPLTKWKKLQELSINDRRSVQSILVAALESEFAKRGLPF